MEDRMKTIKTLIAASIVSLSMASISLLILITLNLSKRLQVNIVQRKIKQETNIVTLKKP